MEPALSPERLHYLLIRHVINTGHAPGPAHLAELAGVSESEVAEAIRGLEAMHGVILVPNSLEVWSVHPFALLPTAFWVSGAGGGWWANCAWCALAIAAVVDEDVTLSTSAGAEKEAIEFRIESATPSLTDLLMHFPEGPSRWWNNPYCPCGNILFFSSEEQIDRWCRRHGRPKGNVLEIGQGMRLAQRWFGDYASPGWRRKTPAEAEAIFRELDLDAGFWDVPGGFR